MRNQPIKIIEQLVVSLAITLLGAVPAMAQTGAIAGRVTDKSNGDPLPGVNVVVQSTTTGAATGAQGHYLITGLDPGTYTLKTSIISYQSAIREGVTVTPGDTAMVNITLSQSSIQLEEAVVVGYGTQQRQDIAGSISSVSSEDIQKLSITSPEQALQGKVAGVQVTKNSSEPGGGISVRIRGTNSVNAGGQPLYVIDGYPVYSQNSKTTTGGVVNQYGYDSSPSALASLSPDDIESIEVLKDASATAIYGSRGSNGVVLITTKSGREGQNRVNFQASYGINQVYNQYDLLGARQYAQYVNGVNNNDAGGDAEPLLNASQFGKGTNWQDEVFGLGGVQNYSLSLAGGNKSTTYRVSGQYYNERGSVVGSGFKRYSFRANLDQNVGDRLTIGTRATISHTRNNIRQTAGTALTLQPILPVYQGQSQDRYFITNKQAARAPRDTLLFGNSSFAPESDNPVAVGNAATRQLVKTRVLGNLRGELRLFDNLTLRSRFGADLVNSKGNVYLPREEGLGGQAGNGSASVGSKQLVNWVNENFLTFDQTFNDRHDVKVQVGQSLQEETLEGVDIGSSNFSTDAARFYDPFRGDKESNPGKDAESYTLASFFGRANYVFNNKYILTTTGRFDGSSHFGEGNRWGFFPSGALAWRISNEPFLENTASWLSNLKLRVSYGITGNQQIEPYQALDRLGAHRLIVNQQEKIGWWPATQAPNPDLGWEETSQLDIGLDVGLLQQRLSLTGDYYYKKTTDLLYETPVPAASGFGTIWRNIGALTNQGLELAVTSYNLVGDFSWRTNANVSLNTNEVTKLVGNDDILIGSSLVREGEPIGAFNTYKFRGVWQSQEQLDAAREKARNFKNWMSAEEGEQKKTPYASAKVGDERYADLNKDGQLSNEDRYIAGNPTPTAHFGLTNTFSYEGLDLSIFLQGEVGNDVLNLTRRSLETLNGRGNITVDAYQNRWTGEGSSKKLGQPSSNYTSRVSDKYVEDGSYLRLKNVRLSYELPTGVLDRFGSQGTSFFVSAQNLFTLTGYSGFDPSVSVVNRTQQIQQNLSEYQVGNIQRGVDSGAYPAMRTYRAGFTLSF